MFRNCRLTADITQDTTGSGSGCSSGITVATGGIKDRMYLYNVSDVEEIVWEDDGRLDTTLSATRIIATDRYYTMDGADTEYNYSYDDGTYTHTLTTKNSVLTPAMEEILSMAATGRYLVFFRPNDSETLRFFGWWSGAVLTHTLDLTDDEATYTLTFTFTGTTPLMSCALDDFDEGSKVYEKIWQRVYKGTTQCVYDYEDECGKRQAEIVAAFNSYGQPLDNNGHIIYYSGENQVAYRLLSYVSESYYYVGVYNEGGTVEGVETYATDCDDCPSLSNSISLDTYSIGLDSSNTVGDVVVRTSGWWSAVSWPDNVIVSNTSGNGDSVVTITVTGGTSGTVVFRNEETLETAELVVNSYWITLEDTMTLTKPTTGFYVIPKVEGGSKNYTYSIVSGSECVSKAEISDELYLYIELKDDCRNGSCAITVRVTHSDDADEWRDITIYQQGADTDPMWTIISRYCED